MPIDYEAIAAQNAGVYAESLAPGSIRLLCIDVPSGSCSFASYKLDEAPPYVCISYTWGRSETLPRDQDESSADDIGLLKVNGADLRVSTNVLAIVGRVMDYGTVEHLWVDAVCINQSDSVERSAQVSMMGEIYHSADIVAVWLGWDERGEFDMVVRICQAVQTAYRRLEEEAAASDSCVPKIASFWEPATRERLGLSFVTDEAWLAFARFWHRTWFYRAWVVQEASLASNSPRFFWGTEELDNDMLYDVSRFLMDVEAGLGQPDGGGDQPRTRRHDWFVLRRRIGETLAKVRALKMLMDPVPENRRLHKSHWRKCDALGGIDTVDGQPRTDCMRLWTHLLEIYRAFDATNPRDHVYASLGILSVTAANHGLDPPDVVVDYARSVAEVYADAARHIMTAGRNVRLLCLAQDPQTRSQPDLPSWVPDFSAGTEMPILMTAATRSQVMPKVCQLAGKVFEERSVSFQFSEDLRILCVDALPLDEIVKVGEWHHELTNDGLWEIIAQILLSQKSFCPDESRIESLWRTMVANTSLDGEAIASSEEIAEYFRAFLLTSLVTKIVRDPHHLDKVPSLKQLLTEECLLAKDMGTANPALVSVDEIQDIAAEVDRRWTAIEQGTPVPQSTPLASRGARFAIATEPMFYRRIILTKRGYLGIGPLSSRAGDLVWIMPGAPLPSVLRRWEEGDGNDVEEGENACFTLLGEAYLHGDPEFADEAAEWRSIELR